MRGVAAASSKRRDNYCEWEMPTTPRVARIHHSLASATTPLGPTDQLQAQTEMSKASVRWAIMSTCNDCRWRRRGRCVVVAER